MAITMYQADRNFVSPGNDASLYAGLVGDSSGILDRGTTFSMSTNGLIITIGTGQAVIDGRLVEISSPESITVPANDSGNICLVVDLTKTNDVSGNSGDPDYSVNVNQVYVAAVTGILQQDDLNNGGFIFEFPIASFVSTSTNATINTIFQALGPTWKRIGTINVQNAGVQISGGSFDVYQLGNMFYTTSWKTSLDGAVTAGQSFLASMIFTPAFDGAAFPGTWDAFPVFANFQDGSSVPTVQMRGSAAIQFIFGSASSANANRYIRVGSKVFMPQAA